MPSSCEPSEDGPIDPQGRYQPLVFPHLEYPHASADIKRQQRGWGYLHKKRRRPATTPDPLPQQSRPVSPPHLSQDGALARSSVEKEDGKGDLRSMRRRLATTADNPPLVSKSCRESSSASRGECQLKARYHYNHLRLVGTTSRHQSPTSHRCPGR